MSDNMPTIEGIAYVDGYIEEINTKLDDKIRVKALTGSHIQVETLVHYDNHSEVFLSVPEAEAMILMLQSAIKRVENE